MRSYKLLAISILLGLGCVDESKENTTSLQSDSLTKTFITTPKDTLRKSVKEVYIPIQDSTKKKISITPVKNLPKQKRDTLKKKYVTPTISDHKSPETRHRIDSITKLKYKKK